MGSGGGGSPAKQVTPAEEKAMEEEKKLEDPTTRMRGPLPSPYGGGGGYLDPGARDAKLDSLLNEDYKKKQEEANKPADTGTLLG